MLQEQTQEEALWNEANNPPEKTYDIFGQLVDLQLFKGAYRSGMRGAQPFDPALDKKAQTIVRFYIQPLPEINVTYANQLSYESPTWGDWGKTTFPSIKALGINDAREAKDCWFRFARVPNGKTYPKSDGTTGEEKTWKVVELYADEAACRAAYVAAGGKAGGNGNGHNAPANETGDAERVQARNIMTVVINNVAPGKTAFADVQEAIKAHAFYPHIEKHYPADSIETMAMITEITKLLPF